SRTPQRGVPTILVLIARALEIYAFRTPQRGVPTTPASRSRDCVLRILYLKPVLVLIAFLIAACAELRSPSPGDLVGGWRYSDQILRCDYVFNRDGSFSGQVIDRGKLVSKFTGRWHIAGRTLNYTYLGDELERIPSGATDQDKLLSVGT